LWVCFYAVVLCSDNIIPLCLFETSPHVSNLPTLTFSITCIAVYTRVFMPLGEKFLPLFTPMDLSYKLAMHCVIAMLPKNGVWHIWKMLEIWKIQLVFKALWEKHWRSKIGMWCVNPWILMSHAASGDWHITFYNQPSTCEINAENNWKCKTIWT
jgi:hypothetical protein